jgi:hypothetical protein
MVRHFSLHFPRVELMRLEPDMSCFDYVGRLAQNQQLPNSEK